MIGPPPRYKNSTPGASRDSANEPVSTKSARPGFPTTVALAIEPSGGGPKCGAPAADTSMTPKSEPTVLSGEAIRNSECNAGALQQDAHSEGRQSTVAEDSGRNFSPGAVAMEQRRGACHAPLASDPVST